eukprot:gnl/MRDRNA2_/MRDRNA2_114334_c0_seq1.p1 gnl/MRDRNA2_/MRDRNA2_114334_c0~~gnl/MRDRNA2_/MRDRNA2_114334_c0_seq1.p1  ORF type:complete len:684 (-),score=117.40 gnl/MRDRNA2_/MRDRNA2_114334_c0_seq1:30-2081(-)
MAGGYPNGKASEEDNTVCSVDDAPEILKRRAQAMDLKEQGNDLAKAGDKVEAAKRYQRGIRLLEPYMETGRLKEDALQELSVLASNCSQMYMDPSNKKLDMAMDRCDLAIKANPKNAKAFFRRATAACERADNLAKGTDAMLAGAQADLRKFLELDPESAAGRSLLEKVTRKRQTLEQEMRPKGDNAPKKDPAFPDWFRFAKNRGVFVSLICRSEQDVDYIEETLLSMATHAKDKWTISVGVAYIPYTKTQRDFMDVPGDFEWQEKWKKYDPSDLQICQEQWQKQYFRMLNLGERGTKVPKPHNVNICGEVYPVWSLLEGRIRVMRVEKTRSNGEQVGTAWLRYCSQLLWHGEPYVFQSTRAYLRFQPNWDEQFKRDLQLASRKPSGIKAVISYTGVPHDYREWKWVSEEGVNYDGHCTHPSGCIAATEFDKNGGCLKFRRRWFIHGFYQPPVVAFYTGQIAFSSSDILMECPADPALNSLRFHEQLTVENIRLHTHGWDVHTASANYVFETNHDDDDRREMLEGPYYERDDNNQPIYPERSDFAKAQLARAECSLDPWENKLSPMDEELMDYPVPTPEFWTGPDKKLACPWPTSRKSTYRWRKGKNRTITSFERMSGVDFTKKEVGERAKNGGFQGDKDFTDNKVAVQQSADARRDRFAKIEDYNRARDAYNAGTYSDKKGP